ncbi:ribosomal small subunit pseudouridine synthase A [Virgibacillus subterraneus]|uniref:Pseudouridine synthase n=2 Tax=Virgibacillus TaxID=84406 RepID=A0A1H1AP76_9BACI|nr:MULTISPECIES: pseudouridine synthase [Virgibacillus]SDQ41568.1 ribosomal small subunit pseudouridine synthase A [Virgibacillus salinus]SEQ08974.1 ribosomal small subunit pseudouridine synthase A [Virgibacillus subterraneus]
MRLDKLLSNMGFGSRKDIKAILKKKHISVNGKTVKDGSMHVDTEMDIIKVQGEIVKYQKYIYLMMNKPPGYVSATVDNRNKTVIDMLPSSYQLFNPFPVGRLDKDTEGLLLITNDGELAHQLISPKKDVEKTYYAKIKGHVTEDDIIKFKNGITLDDGYQAKPARLQILHTDIQSEIEVTVTEGKFHQVKRMFDAVNKKVVYLKRIRMGELELDCNLSTGDIRELTKDEMKYCLSQKKS